MSRSPAPRIHELTPADRVRVLTDAIKDHAVFLLDDEGRVASWNAAAERLTGHSADDVVGQDAACFFTEDDRALGLPQRALSMAAAGRFEAEGWRLRKDGGRFFAHAVIDPIVEDGQVIGYAQILRDVSERRLRDEALLASEQRFKLLVESVRDYAIYMLDTEGRVTNWNAGAEAIKGYSAEEIVGQHFRRFYTDVDQAAGEPEKALATALREGHFTAETRRVRKSGELFWASVVIHPIFDHAGAHLGYAKVTRDVTERRRAQEELEASRKALAQSQKMEAIGRLTGGVAHDFNNLLTVVRASGEFLMRPDLDEARRLRYATAIVETAERAARLTGQLLAFARRQPLQPQVFAVGARMKGLGEMIGATLGSTVKLNLDLPADDPAIEVDPNQFDTAVLNLIINARDAMPSGGRVDIRLRTADRVPAVRGHAGARGDFVAVEISDSGEGIPAEIIGRIFEPFFTTKPVDKGTGLGLSQVYGFAKQSRGEIDARSRPGEGSTFTLYLPRSAQPVEIDLSAARAGAAEPPPKRRILLVEDNEAVGAFAAMLLGELGQEVVRAGDAQAAIAAISSDPTGFDLVFSDMVMPGISGVELGRIVRERWPQLPFVLTTGYSGVLAEDPSHGFRIITKPYAIEELSDLLRS